MTQTVNPILPLVALLRPQMPGVYSRSMIYDITYNDPSYNAYPGVRIIPAIGSIVRDTDETPLWVIATDDVTFIPSYTAIPLSTENDNVVSVLNYGNSVFRLYVDYRALPYPVTPDSKCIFIGKSPRFYTLSRYPNTTKETIISQYYDTTGKLASHQIPLVALDKTNSSWYLPRSHVSVTLDDNEEVIVKVYAEDGAEVYSAIMFSKQSAVINEDVVYAPTIVGMTISGNQQLINGTFFLYEKQSFDSLGLTATLVYDDGSTSTIPIDGEKCILYGQTDFISSFAGLTQNVTVKYYRSDDEAIVPGLSDATGSMISTSVPVTVIPNELATTNKIITIPVYNATLGQYLLKYWLYFADGRSHIDITPYTTIESGSVVTDSSHYGVAQTYAIGVDMSQIDPVHYPTTATYQQNIVITLYPPTVLVKWILRDATTSPYILGQDNALSRRPSLRYDSVAKQYFIPGATFVNLAAFINSFYTQASPPYDPSVSLIPQTPTHFTVRDALNGQSLIAAPIKVESYAQAFTILGDTVGKYVGISVMIEFINVINTAQANVLFACPVDVTAGTYVGS